MLSPSHILIHFFAFSRSDLRSQSGYASLGQSKREVSPVFREIEYGLAGCYSGLVYGRHGIYPGGFGWPQTGDWQPAEQTAHSSG